MTEKLNIPGPEIPTPLPDESPLGGGEPDHFALWEQELADAPPSAPYGADIMDKVDTSTLPEARTDSTRTSTSYTDSINPHTGRPHPRRDDDVSSTQKDD